MHIWAWVIGGVVVALALGGLVLFVLTDIWEEILSPGIHCRHKK